MDNVLSGAPGASPEAAGRAGGTEPGRLTAAAPGEWPDVALIYRQHHADLVRQALLLVGDRASAEAERAAHGASAVADHTAPSACAAGCLLGCCAPVSAWDSG